MMRRRMKMAVHSLHNNLFYFKILLPTGEVIRPHLWQPETVPMQIVRVGSLFILVMPGEFTTMAGRRLRDTVRDVLVAEGIANPTIVLTGLSGSYSDYITTKGTRSCTLGTILTTPRDHNRGVRGAALRGRLDDLRPVHADGLPARVRDPCARPCPQPDRRRGHPAARLLRRAHLVRAKDRDGYRSLGRELWRHHQRYKWPTS